MRTKIYDEDQGVDFGTWTDPVSKFLYDDSIEDILTKVPLPRTIADYGGANGLIKRHIPWAVTVDIDPSKNPDIVDNILDHRSRYGLVIVRYVLHYLSDREVIQLLYKINAPHILLVQFVNDNLRMKYHNSINEEQKYFRTEAQTKALLPPGMKEIYSHTYLVDEEFYTNRLGAGSYIPHRETLKAYYK